MAIYRGLGGSGTTSDTAALDEITINAQEAAQSATDAASSASASATSATNAASSASSASTSATNAATSETNAANSATASANSATASANSATASSNSATASETSYQNTLAIYGDTQDVANAVAAAQAAQTGAETAETNAATSASNASASATASANSATASASSASSAATSETNAANSATAASTSETNAANSASNAANSATASANSATASAASATSAANSAAAAAASLDNFDDRYLGSKASDPSVDNDGNALVTGALYYNSTSGEMRVYDGSLWVAASSASIETMEKFKFTATSGQTVFSGSDDSSRTLSLIAGVEIVTLNGIVLEADTDYTATNSAITLATGATADDEVNVYAFGNFQVADTVSKSLGGTFTGAVTFENGTNYGNSSSFGQIRKSGGELEVNSYGTGGASEPITFNQYTTERMRIDSNGNVGIGTSSPAAKLQVVGSTNTDVALLGTAGTRLTVEPDDAIGEVKLKVEDPSGNNYQKFITFHTEGGSGVTERMRINASGNVGIGTSSPATGTHLQRASGNTYYRAQNNLANVDFGVDGAGTGILWNNSNYPLTFGTNNTERMRIDSAGRVTMPYQPAFKAYDSTGTTWSSTNLIPNVAILNRGNCYSTSTGRFTAPVAGFYVFKTDWRNAGSTGWMDIRASNGEKARHEEAGQATANQYHQSLVLMVYLNAGDYVWIEAGSQVRWDPNSIDSFAGYLAG